MKKHNTTAKLKKNRIRFVLYGTKQTLPMLGRAKVTLQCEEGKKVNTTVYVVAGQIENLLGERDSVALGILKIKPRGDKPSQERVRYITEVKKRAVPTIGKISGGQTQAEIQ